MACRGGIGEGLNFAEHLGERLDAGEVNVELGLPGAAKVNMSIVESRKDEGAGAGAVQVAKDGVRARRAA